MNPEFWISTVLCVFLLAASGGIASDRSAPSGQKTPHEQIPVADLIDVPPDEPSPANETSVRPADPVSAQDLLESVVARFPRDPLVIEGDLIVKKRRGVVVRQHPFRMSLNWGGSPAKACYAVFDNQGGTLEELRVTRQNGQSPVLEYKAAYAAARPFNIFEPVLGSDIAWIDLTLSFLWWDGGTVIGTDRIRGYNCYVVDIPAPSNLSTTASAPGERRPISPNTPPRTSLPYTRVRLWIEQHIRVLLQAEGYDSRGEVIRRLGVRSCKKINDRWMIKDMEVQSYPAVHRTKLSIQGVNLAEQP